MRTLKEAPSQVLAMPIPEAEISTFDLRYESHRMKNRALEERLLVSIISLSAGSRISFSEFISRCHGTL